MREPLPIYEALPALKTHLQTQPTVILQAPPGAGKSTVLPLELLNEPWLHGQRILMLEPRRLAARSVATRMSDLLGEEVGQTVGYRVRFEQRISARTRIEVLTEGILTRRLQHDPELNGIGLVIFDEFHERSLHADLALALCREAQQALRNDLRLLVMSATLDGDALSAILGNAPIISTSGRQFAVQVNYAARDPVELPYGLGGLPNVVADAVSRALAEHDGDVLAFLPGAAEIQRAERILAERHSSLQVRPLFGELTLEAQQSAILPDAAGRRKVVLASAIAETSLTIEGVRVVVDSGLARIPHFDSRSGLTQLETVRVTLDSANQRAGRAGRLGPGVCYRLWSAQTHARLNPSRKPEILEADLAPLRLELAQWGVRDVTDLNWVTAPPVGAIRHAQEVLTQLGALDGHRLTPDGQAMLDFPTHPRLAHLLVRAAKLPGGKGLALACDVAALLDDRDPLLREEARTAGADLTLRVEALRHWRATQRGLYGADMRALARIERVAAQWRKQLNVRVDNIRPDAYEVGALVMLAYPDRIAQTRDKGTAYRLANGRGVQLAQTDALAHSPWLAVAHLDGAAGTSGSNAGDIGRIFLAAPLHEDDLKPITTEHEVLGWDAKQGILVARRERRVGELVLSSQPSTAMSPAKRAQVLCDVVRSEGLSLLNWTEAARQWQARVQSLRLWRGEAWPDVSDETLLARLEDWLLPYLDKVSKRDDFARLDVLSIISALLPWAAQNQLAALAPTHLDVPSGSSIALEYAAGAPPVLAVKLQEMFGLADTPTVNEGRTKVMLHLLSPARQPIQVTQDLRSFWANTYPVVRKELRGRYNKHPWPEDPWNAPPTRKTLKALARG